MSLPLNRILVGDALEQLSQLPASSVDMVLTSPPYFRLRDYAVTGQLGLEAHVSNWVANLQAIARELHRVLLPTGTFWLNLGDSYSLRTDQGAPRKSLLLGPERLALELLQDGWLLRNKLVWQKANPVPNSVRDRLTCSWEVVYVFAKNRRYYFDLDTIREPHISRRRRPKAYRRPATPKQWRGPNSDTTGGLAQMRARGAPGHPLGKNPGDVWRITSSSYRGGHPATFPVELAQRAIQAGCPEARCPDCQSPWYRPLLRPTPEQASRGSLTPGCTCSSDREPAVVLDPFLGAGTTAVAALQLGRNWLGIELNPTFVDLANRRIRHTRDYQTTAQATGPGGSQMA